MIGLSFMIIYIQNANLTLNTTLAFLLLLAMILHGTEGYKCVSYRCDEMRSLLQAVLWKRHRSLGVRNPPIIFEVNIFLPGGGERQVLVAKRPPGLKVNLLWVLIYCGFED